MPPTKQIQQNWPESESDIAIAGGILMGIAMDISDHTIVTACSDLSLAQRRSSRSLLLEEAWRVCDELIPFSSTEISQWNVSFTKELCHAANKLDVFLVAPDIAPNVAPDFCERVFKNNCRYNRMPRTRGGSIGVVRARDVPSDRHLLRRD